MKDKEIIIKELLVFKSKTLADQNERSANVNNEFDHLKKEIKSIFVKFRNKIKDLDDHEIKWNKLFIFKFTLNL